MRKEEGSSHLGKVLLTGMAAFTAVMTLKMLPDLRRYLRIKRM